MQLGGTLKQYRGELRSTIVSSVLNSTLPPPLPLHPRDIYTVTSGDLPAFLVWTVV